MSEKKSKLTKKDKYILILGVLFGFLMQIGYDVAHEIAYFGIEPINWYWVSLQILYIVLFGFFALLIERQIE